MGINEAIVGEDQSHLFGEERQDLNSEGETELYASGFG